MSHLILPIQTATDGISVVSTLDFAAGLHVQHASLIKTIREYQPVIEKDFGQVRFEIRTVQNSVGAVNEQIFAYLTEDQSIFVGTLSRNSDRVVEFKSVLVRSFAEARKRIAELTAPSYQVNDPIERAQRWIEEERQRQALQEENSRLRPKAEYAEKVLESGTLLTTTVIASQLGLSAKALNRKLSALRIQRKQSGTWVLYANYLNKGYADLRTHAYHDSAGQPKTAHLLVWTEKGRALIHQKLNPLLSATQELSLELSEPGMA